jgi:hypothetical protein
VQFNGFAKNYCMPTEMALPVEQQLQHISSQVATAIDLNQQFRRMWSVTVAQNLQGNQVMDLRKSLLKVAY